MGKAKSLIFLTFAMGAMAALVVPAAGKEVTGMEVSPSNQIVERDYDAIPGQFNSPLIPFANVRPTACRTAPYCDTIPLKATPPKPYKGTHTIVVTLTWKPLPPFPPGDNLHLWIWDNDDAKEIFGPLASDTAGPAAGALANYPRRLKLGDLEGPYFVTVVNYRGPNLGYHVMAEWVKGKLPDLDYQLPNPESFAGPGGSTATGASTSPASRGAGVRLNEAGEQEALAPGTVVKVPGPDGELVEMTIPVLAQQSRRQEKPFNPIVPASIALLVLGAVTFFIFFFSRRRSQSEA